MYLCNSLTILVNVKRKHISSNEALKKSFREEGKTCRGFLMTFLDLFQTGAGGGGDMPARTSVCTIHQTWRILLKIIWRKELDVSRVTICLQASFSKF